VYSLLCVLSQYQEYKIGAAGENIAQPRDAEAAAPEQRPRRLPATTTASVTEDVNSNNALLLPSAEKLGAGPSTGTLSLCTVS
ncbi:uncharacterized protein CEXT_486881, partial [Caerostris extrusa]